MVSPTQLLISLGPLDPAFKGNPQQFATHVVERMTIVSPSGIVSFVVGDTEPLYNAGPWLKNGTSWWVYDDVSKRYIPLDISDTVLGATVAALITQLAALIDANGFLLDGTVWKPSVLVDRIITQPKLHWNSIFYCAAAGADTYSATLMNSDGSSPVPTFGDGTNTSLAIFVKIGAANTIPGATLSINGSANYPVIKGAGVPLLAGDLQPGRVYLMVFDGVSFQVTGDIAEPASVTTPTSMLTLTSSSGSAYPGVVGSYNTWFKTSLTGCSPPAGGAGGVVLVFNNSTFSLDPGTYDATACIEIGQCRGRIRIYDTTGGATLVSGVNGGCGNNVNGNLMLFGRFVLTVNSICQLEFYCDNISGGTQIAKFGAAAGTGEDEMWAMVQVTKIG